MVGATVSTPIVTVGRSGQIGKILVETPITALVVLFALGVNVAVYFVPDPEKLLKVPPETVMSPTTKSETDTLIAKFRVADWPMDRLD